MQLKVLSDRRAEGGGIAWLVRITPPEGKVIRIVAVALSDEHIFGLEGGRGTKSGERLRAEGNYGLNPKGKPHSAFIGTETVSLVIYNGEPDEIRSLDVIDRPPPVTRTGPMPRQQPGGDRAARAPVCTRMRAAAGDADDTGTDRAPDGTSRMGLSVRARLSLELGVFPDQGRARRHAAVHGRGRCVSASARSSCTAVVAISGSRMPTSPRTWFAFLGMGVLNNCMPFCLIAWGQTRSPAVWRRS